MFSAGLIWKAAAFGDDDDYGSAEQPEFHRPDYWADWIAMLGQNEHEDAVRRAGCSALLAYYVQDTENTSPEWVTPGELIAAADRFLELMKSGDPQIESAVMDYLNPEVHDRPDAYEPRPTRDDLLGDLDMLKSMARWAEQHGKVDLAIEIG